MKTRKPFDLPKKAGGKRRWQYAALPWRRTVAGRLEILLITSRETRRWVIPKGWPMKKKTPWQAAAQEAFEEAGIEGDITVTPLGVYRYLKRMGSRPEPDREVQICTVHVYPLRVIEELEDWPERLERERRWMTPHEAASLVQEPELAALIQAFDALDGQFEA